VKNARDAAPELGIFQAFNNNQQAFVFTISLSNAVGHSVTVNYATADGTATTADGDYQAASGSVTFAAGETSQTVTILVVGDNDQEGDQDFAVQLSNAQGANVSDATGTGTILEDDTKGKGGNGGGGNCNPNSPKCNNAADEIEMQDPIWWFEGPDAESGHFHDHNQGQLPHEDEALFALVSSNSRAVDRLLEEVDETSEALLVDRAVTDLEIYAVPLSVELPSESRIDTSETKLDETGLYEELVDTLLGELVDGLV
jgi:hypothetical protein